MRPQTPDYVERTALAWVRTGLSLVGVDAVVARLATLERSWAALGTATVGLVCAVALVLPNAMRLRRVRAASGEAVLAAAGAVACAGLATVMLILA